MSDTNSSLLADDTCLQQEIRRIVYNTHLSNRHLDGVFSESFQRRPGSAPPQVDNVSNMFLANSPTSMGNLSSEATVDFLQLDGVEDPSVLSDPAYINYYYQNKNINPRLPPPILSREQHLRSMWMDKQADTKVSSLASPTDQEALSMLLTASLQLKPQDSFMGSSWPGSSEPLDTLNQMFSPKSSFLGSNDLGTPKSPSLFGNALSPPTDTDVFHEAMLASAPHSPSASGPMYDLPTGAVAVARVDVAGSGWKDPKHPHRPGPSKLRTPSGPHPEPLPGSVPHQHYTKHQPLPAQGPADSFSQLPRMDPLSGLPPFSASDLSGFLSSPEAPPLSGGMTPQQMQAMYMAMYPMYASQGYSTQSMMQHMHAMASMYPGFNPMMVPGFSGYPSFPSPMMPPGNGGYSGYGGPQGPDPRAPFAPPSPGPFSPGMMPSFAMPQDYAAYYHKMMQGTAQQQGGPSRQQKPPPPGAQHAQSNGQHAYQGKPGREQDNALYDGLPDDSNFTAPRRNGATPERSYRNPRDAPRDTRAGPRDGMNGSPMGPGGGGSRRRREDAEKKMDPLLEEFKANKGHEWSIQNIVGHVVDFSLDQHGSRFIQQKLDLANKEDVAVVYTEVMPKATSLMVDVFGNYVVQKLLEHGSEEQRQGLADTLKGHVLSLSLQMYGCRVVQRAIEVLPVAGKCVLVSELDGSIMKCVRDQNGNHVIQKCIECIPTHLVAGMIDMFLTCVVRLSAHPFGCRVVQRILEHCQDSVKRQVVMDEILANAATLALDQYGNYVIQHTVEHGTDEERKEIVSKLSTDARNMSMHKFASNVIEKCLTFCCAEDRDLLISNMVGCAPSPVSGEQDPVQIMMKDQFGNYVVQKVLEVCDDDQRDALLARVRTQLHALKKYTYGKHIVARVEKLLSAGTKLQSNAALRRSNLPDDDAIAQQMAASNGKHHTSYTEGSGNEEDACNEVGLEEGCQQ